MTKPKVFIVCEPTVRLGDHRVRAVDLTPAAEWGEPIILIGSSQSMIDPSPTIVTLREKLANFSDEDFLVPIGDPALMCVAAMIAGEANSGRVRFLKWDRRLSRYFPIQVSI